MEFSATIVYLLFTLHSVSCGKLFQEVPQTDERTRFKECRGTNNVLSTSGTPSHHYDWMRRHYKGCTFVNGNLEITNLQSPDIRYDLGFLKDVEIVTGYVFISLVTEVDVISLPRLKLIRADSTLTLLGSEYGLAVALTSETDETQGLRKLFMPSLKEISRGHILFLENPLLCHVDTIDWDHMTPNRHNVLHLKNNGHSDDCEPCSSDCLAKNVSGCWGPEERHCQQVNTMPCASTCLNHCFATGMFGCCHPECAVGCTGPLDTDCHMCKFFRYNGRCVSTCPEDEYPIGQRCTSNPILFTSTDDELRTPSELTNTTKSQTKIAELYSVQTESKNANSQDTFHKQSDFDSGTNNVDEFLKLPVTLHDPFIGDSSSLEPTVSPRVTTTTSTTSVSKPDAATTNTNMDNVETEASNITQIAHKSSVLDSEPSQESLSSAGAAAATEHTSSDDLDPQPGDAHRQTGVQKTRTEQEPTHQPDYKVSETETKQIPTHDVHSEVSEQEDTDQIATHQSDAGLSETATNETPSYQSDAMVIETDTKQIPTHQTEASVIKTDSKQIPTHQTEASVIETDSKQIPTHQTEISVIKTDSKQIPTHQTEISVIKTDSKQIPTHQTEISVIKTDSKQIPTHQTEASVIKTDSKQIPTHQTEASVIEIDSKQIPTHQTEASVIKTDTKQTPTHQTEASVIETDSKQIPTHQTDMVTETVTKQTPTHYIDASVPETNNTNQILTEQIDTRVSESYSKPTPTSTSTPNDSTITHTAEPESRDLSTSNEEIPYDSHNGSRIPTALTNHSERYDVGGVLPSNLNQSYDGKTVKYDSGRMSHVDEIGNEE